MKKALCLLLTLVIFASVFTGCELVSSFVNGNGEENPTVDVNKPADEPNDEPAEVPKDEPKDDIPPQPPVDDKPSPYEDLISALTVFMDEDRMYINPAPSTMKLKFVLMLEGQKPAIVEFDPLDYYFVCAYFYGGEDHYEDFCCMEQYTWVTFENAEDITETHEGKALIRAFQINRAKSCFDIMSDSDADYTIENFMVFDTSFTDGVNTNPALTIDKKIIRLFSGDKDVYHCSYSVSHQRNLLFEYVELDGELYFRVYINQESTDGTFSEPYLDEQFGSYYDELMAVMITGKYSVEQSNGSIYHYGLVRISDAVSIVENRMNS